ncbi:MOSC domain-containing protein [Thalassococcus lentus]|uniref:MOSC domain-containing protein n=1 Tax=Thalassococcus lentus TaxID=1210524 RepID=A0ABT4XTA3_9RHOB|nr:MOSC domain-containing protein [Thalassococcus lentus]MDA7425198.1 MOSC domain-containing protein [Thalassococcus lentus]
MPALKPTDFRATIVWLGCVPKQGDGLQAEECQSLELDWAGPVGERHAGLTRPSCSRVTSQHTRGTEIANARQLSVLSAEEMDAIAAEMGLDTLDPRYLGVSLLLKGIPDFTHVPPSSRLQAPDGATIVIDMENRPCVLPGREIEVDKPGFGARFKSAAKGRRGVTAWVERPGMLKIGDTLRLHIPDQPAWQPGG